MKTAKFYLTGALLLLCAGSLMAQFITDTRKAADAYFRNGEYYAAAEFYKKALANVPADSALTLPYPVDKSRRSSKSAEAHDQEHILFHLAESYRLYNNHREAEAAYRKVLGSKDPKYRLAPYRYAQSLRKNGKFGEASEQFSTFLASYTTPDDIRMSAELALASCRFALAQMEYPLMLKISRLGGEINTAGSNYGLVRGGNSYYFTSSRPSGKTEPPKTFYADNAQRVMLKNNPYLNAIYETGSLENNVAPEVHKIDIDGNFNEVGAPAFTPDGKYLFYTGWSGKKGKNVYAIYRSEKDNSGKWSKGAALASPVNIAGQHSKQPSVSPDGKYLLFASDRPGGAGKYDLWYAPLSLDGTPQTVNNFGPAINSAGDEEAPHYNSTTSQLVFSSNGRIGMGGFDFYHSKGNFHHWSEPQNLGYPMNSPKDDLYFYPADSDGTKGYISSDRSSECCLELFSVELAKLTISGTLTDCDRQTVIKGGKVTLTDSVTSESREVYTNEKGIFTFDVDRRRPFRIAAENQHYFAKTTLFSRNVVASAESAVNASMCLTPYQIDVPIVMKEVFYDFNSAALTDPSKGVLDSLAKILTDNPRLKIELSSHTDSVGSDAYNHDLSQKRAQACVDYLIGKGIASERLIARGYGESRAVAPNSFPDGKDNAGGRQLNRRTEFKVLND